MHKLTIILGYLSNHRSNSVGWSLKIVLYDLIRFYLFIHKKQDLI